jgi:CheY-like chemotaxis protein
MDAEAQAHAFEPFFTTKEVGEGTGLGLATVFGIVRQVGGALRADSTLGQGTAITILLPAVEGEDAGDSPASAEAGPAATGASILLVEDEAPVRIATRRMLERRGYTVLEARHGADALLLWRKHAEVIDAVVTDLRMPEMGGRELVAMLHGTRPGLPVVYVSGYSDQRDVAGRAGWEAFVEKPFTAEGLLEALEGVLQHAPRSERSTAPARSP